MSDPLRQEVIAAAHTIVVKVGTRVLTRPDATLNTERIARLAEEIAGIADSGRKVVLVSSGAVGAGVGLMKLDKGTKRFGRAFLRPPPPSNLKGLFM